MSTHVLASLAAFNTTDLTSAGYTRGRVSIVSRQAGFTVKAHCVVETVETAPNVSVTDWAQRWIYVSMTLTCSTPTNLCITPEGKYNTVVSCG